MRRPFSAPQAPKIFLLYIFLRKTRRRRAFLKKRSPNSGTGLRALNKKNGKTRRPYRSPPFFLLLNTVAKWLQFDYCFFIDVPGTLRHIWGFEFTWNDPQPGTHVRKKCAILVLWETPLKTPIGSGQGTVFGRPGRAVVLARRASDLPGTTLTWNVKKSSRHLDRQTASRGLS